MRKQTFIGLLASGLVAILALTLVIGTYANAAPSAQTDATAVTTNGASQGNVASSANSSGIAQAQSGQTGQNNAPPILFIILLIVLFGSVLFASAVAWRDAR